MEIQDKKECRFFFPLIIIKTYFHLLLDPSPKGSKNWSLIDELTTCYTKLIHVASTLHLLQVFELKVIYSVICPSEPAYYRVVHKFSDTWNELFVVNWFISKFFWGNTKWKKASSPHYLKILMKLSKHGISYSLKRDLRLISKITFCANLSVSPINIEL